MNRKPQALFIGEFPPPYGGVTIKNKMIINFIHDDIKLIVINIYDYKKHLYKIPKLISLLIDAKKKKLKIYMGNGSLLRLHLLLLIIYFIGGSQMLGRTSNYIMGGQLKDYCKKHKSCLKLMKKTKIMFVELQTMIEEFNSLGLNNTFFFPNCKDGSKSKPTHRLDKDTGLRLLFFSGINREKGVPVLFEVADLLKKNHIKYSLDLYGGMDSTYEEEFYEKLKKYPEFKYCGVFDVLKYDLYENMNKYDMLLFPTRWKGESLPGVLVESKMSGIPALVTDHRYNGEIVIDGKEGVVVKGDLASGFAEAIINIYNNEDYYKILAKGAYESRLRYDIHTYIHKIKEINNS